MIGGTVEHVRNGNRHEIQKSVFRISRISSPRISRDGPNTFDANGIDREPVLWRWCVQTNTSGMFCAGSASEDGALLRLNSPKPAESAQTVLGHTVIAEDNNMPANQNWTRSETLAALHVYLLLPFGQLHRNQPLIKQLAVWIGRTPNSVALKLVNLASLDPQIVASGRRGMGNVSTLDRATWQELLTHWDRVALEAASEYERLATSNGLSADADVADQFPAIEEGRTRMATVKIRVNQARFRKAVLASYDSTCCISGLRHEQLLVASHIVPWSQDEENRLNPQNGLCLSALHDRAYDQGLITVTPDYRVRVSPKLRAKADKFTADALLCFDGRLISMPERFRPSAQFLCAHATRFDFL